MRCNLEKKLETLAEELFLVRAELVDIFCNSPARKIDFIDTNIRVCSRISVWGVAIVDNPEFASAFSLGPNIVFKGKHIVFELNYIVVGMYAILRPHGEPVVEGLEDRLRQLEIK